MNRHTRPVLVLCIIGSLGTRHSQELGAHAGLCSGVISLGGFSSFFSLTLFTTLITSESARARIMSLRALSTTAFACH